MNFHNLKNQKFIFDDEAKTLPPGFPTFWEVFWQVVEQMEADGTVGIFHSPGEPGPNLETAWEEARLRYQGLVSVFGKPAGNPYLSREAAVAAGRWVAKKPGTRRAKPSEVEEWVRNFYIHGNDETFLAMTQEDLAKAFQKETGLSTTRQVVAKTEAYQVCRKKVLGLREEAKRNLPRFSRRGGGSA